MKPAHSIIAGVCLWELWVSAFADPVCKSGFVWREAFAGDRERPYAHPFYWAPFTLVGNWR
jgi:CHAT domain-containing protein